MSFLDNPLQMVPATGAARGRITPVGAGPGAKRVFVAKDVGARNWQQARIDAAIVAAALRGRPVVRLKSGGHAARPAESHHGRAARTGRRMGVPHLTL